ncbi:MAG: lytic transglycosylase domain-containing protein [Desulfobacterales bacterium]|nr:lytic transglycosylase domain-containing protein [Desulfobacterales bacterium]
MKINRPVNTCILLFLLTTAAPVFADIYKYVDKNGVLHFTNTPTVNRDDYKLYVKENLAKHNEFRSTDKYDDIISTASSTYGVSFSMIKAIIKAESDFDSMAVSKKGAMGLMQLMPENIESFKIKNPFDPKENIMGGANYFKDMMKRYNGKLTLALAAYNAGPTAVDEHNGVPPFKETEAYVKKVLKYYYNYKKQS